jgi:DNA invertase Pin-like site-specific DNA recombinase
MKIGYARVSTIEQNLDMQLDALKEAGCDRVYEDKASGAKTDRQGLRSAIENLREGDTLVVYKLDRIGRSLKDLISIITDLNEKSVQIVSIKDSIDTSSASGKLMLNMLCVLADYERTLIRERTNAGLQAARARGRSGGRPSVLTAQQIKAARALYDSKQVTIDDICKQINCSKPTFYRNVVNATS